MLFNNTTPQQQQQQQQQQQTHICNVNVNIKNQTENQQDKQHKQLHSTTTTSTIKIATNLANGTHNHNQSNTSNNNNHLIVGPINSNNSNNNNNNSNSSTTNNNNNNNISFATDFSIAAIMAKGAGNALSREPSERSLSPLSVERYSAQDADDDVDVDVVDCSDTESTSSPTAVAIAASTIPTTQRNALRLQHKQQHQQQQQHQHQHQQHFQQYKSSGNSTSSSSTKHNRHLHHSQHHHQHQHQQHQQASSRGNSGNSRPGGGRTTSSPPTPPLPCDERQAQEHRRRSAHSPANNNIANDEDVDDERLSPEEPAKLPTPKIVGSCNCDDLMPVHCHLETKELWDKFHELGTEMIITKSGRRMFPTVRVSFSGPLRQTQPPDRYAVLLDVVPLDARRYRYAYHRSSWLVAGKADPPPPARLYAHPDSPISLEALRKQVVSFEKVKLTNNEMDKSGQVVLNSMHRYQPRIHLVRLSHGQSIPANPKELQDMDHKTYVFPETVFTAVTAYQNQLITKLKIDSNPFAKGFRDSSRLTDFDRDPMDSFLFDQHMRAAPLRFFPDPLLQQLSPQEADAASLAFLEKARQHLQLFGRSPYTEMLLPHLYQRAAPPPPPSAAALSAFQLGMWQQQWPQLTAGFLASANQQAAVAAAAAAAAVAANHQRHSSPPPAPSGLSNINAISPAQPPPPATTPTSSSGGSPSPDLRIRHPHHPQHYQRFSPYQVPQHSPAQHASSHTHPVTPTPLIAVVPAPPPSPSE